MTKDKEARRKISWKDIQRVVQNVEEYYGHYRIQKREPLLLIKAVASIYKEQMKKLPNQNIDLNLKKNRPEILRDEVIRLYTGAEPDDSHRDTYRLHKYQINDRLREFCRNNKNPKCLILKTSSRKGEAETFNYFVSIAPMKKALKTPEQTFRRSLRRWKTGKFDGAKAIDPSDLIHVEMIIKPDLDEESLAYFYVSCVYRRFNYHIWWKKVKEHPKVIRHLVNLLFQSYHRPFWRAAFILQYADPKLFYTAVSKYPQDLLENERVKKGINAIVANNVIQYLKKNKDKELYAKELLKEFSIYRRYFEKPTRR